MRVRNHKIEGVPYTAARLIGGAIVPEIVVLHDTAGRLEKGNSAAWLATATQASVHLVVERDGSVAQLVPLNRRAGHAGKSSFQGRPDCNAFSIGIEIVNPGRMTWLRDGRARAWFGQAFDAGEEDMQEVTTPEHGTGVWMHYPEPQLEAVERLLGALFDGVPTLRDLTTHWYVSPGRKVDTNPLFPLEAIRARVLGRDDPADLAAEKGSEPVVEALVAVKTRGSSLNMRRWPSFNPNVVGSIPDGTVVPVLRVGTFGGEDWELVRYDGREGWVLSSYTDIVS